MPVIPAKAGISYGPAETSCPGTVRLAALIRASNNFAGVNLNDGAALAAFLDRHSGGAAAPLVDCFLVRPTCDTPEAPPSP